MLMTCNIYASASGSIGLKLSRAPWEPYPWVSCVQAGSSAHRAGLRSGDTVLELNGANVLGQRLTDVAAQIRQHWLSGATLVTAIVWRNYPPSAAQCLDRDGKEQENLDPNEEANWHRSINQQSLQKFATCLQHIAQLLECPICLEVIKPPGWQCCNGHVLCNNCRGRSLKCPVCRVPLGPRGRCLLADKLHTLLAETFPCESVRSNENSPATARKCHTPELQPEVALVDVQQIQQPQQQQLQHNPTKGKDIKRKVKYFGKNLQSQTTEKFQPGRAAEEFASAGQTAEEHLKGDDGCTVPEQAVAAGSQLVDKVGDQVHNDQSIDDEAETIAAHMRAATQLLQRRTLAARRLSRPSSASRNNQSMGEQERPASATCCC